MKRALVRRPSSRLAAGERTFVAARPLDVELARRQHVAYVAELERLGYTAHWLSELEEHADGVFVEDAAVVVDGELALLTRPGAASRRAETESVAGALARYRELEYLDEPCTLDGGDVLALGEDLLLVGQSSRTNHAALKALAHLVLPRGLRVKAVEVSGCLHLKTALSWLGGDAVLANPGWIHMGRLPPLDVIEVDAREPFAANVLVANGAVLAPSSYPRTAERLAARGYDVRLLELSEILKAEGGPTCLSLLLESA